MKINFISILPLRSLHHNKVFFHFTTTFTTPWLRHFHHFILLLRSLRHDQEKKKILFCYYALYVMIKREQSFFFSFSHYVRYAMIKTEKSFFNLATTFTTPWSKEKKSFFYLIISFTTPWLRMKKVLFTYLLRSLRHDQVRKKFFSFNHYFHHAMIKNEKSFFQLFTKFTTPWSREKNFFFISVLYSLSHGHKKKKLIFIALIPWSWQKYPFFIIC